MNIPLLQTMIERRHQSVLLSPGQRWSKVQLLDLEDSSFDSEGVGDDGKRRTKGCKGRGDEKKEEMAKFGVGIEEALWKERKSKKLHVGGHNRTFTEHSLDGHSLLLISLSPSTMDHSLTSNWVLLTLQ
jgi:hypothetical protein